MYFVLEFHILYIGWPKCNESKIIPSWSDCICINKIYYCQAHLWEEPVNGTSKWDQKEMQYDFSVLLGRMQYDYYIWLTCSHNLQPTTKNHINSKAIKLHKLMVNECPICTAIWNPSNFMITLKIGFYQISQPVHMCAEYLILVTYRDSSLLKNL